MTSPNLFNQILIWPIVNILILFYKALVFIGIPGSFGWAIVILTLGIRLILYPLTVSQLRSAKKMAELKPHLDRLAKKHKKDKQRLQKEQLRLYQQAGINPAGGCLPMLLQFPVLIALYRVFFSLLSSGNLQELISDINAVVYAPILKIETLDLSFYGVNLAVKPNQWQQLGVGLLLIPIITAALQFIQSRMMMQATSGKKNNDGQKMTKNENNGKEEKKDGSDMQKAMQMQTTYFMPVLIGYFALSFPIGLSLYWNTFSLFGIMQQALINKERSGVEVYGRKKKQG